MWIFGYGSLVWKADFPYIKKVVGYVKGYERRFWQASVDHRGVPGKPGRVVTLVPSSDPDARVWGTAYKIHSRDSESVVQQLDLREVMGYERVPIEFHPVSDHPLNEFDVKPVVDTYSSSNDGAGFTAGRNFMSNVDMSMDVDDERGLLHSVSSKGSSLHGENESDSGLSINDNESKSETDTEYETEGSMSGSEDDDEPDPHYEDIKFGRAFRAIMYFGSEQNEHYVGPAPAFDMAKQIYECAGFSGRNIEYLLNLCDAMREICDEALDSHLQELESIVLYLRDQDTSLGSRISATNSSTVNNSHSNNSDSDQTHQTIAEDSIVSVWA